MRKIIILACVVSCAISAQAFAKPLLDIQHWQTKKGVPVYFVAAHEVPMVDILVGFYAGSAHDGKQLGLAALTSNTLASGSQHYTADTIAEQFAANGAQFNTNANKDLAIVSLRSLSKPANLQASLSVVTDVLQHPTFPVSEVTRERNSMLAVLQYQQQQPNVMAKQTFDRLLYQGHPYANPVIGEQATVSQLTQAAVVKFYKTYYVAQNAMIVIVGDQTVEQAKALGEQISQALADGKKAKLIGYPAANPKAQLKTINFPSDQTHIVMGEMVVGYNDPDYVALSVGNYVLGGQASMTSLLQQEIRIKRGLTYSISSQINPLLDGSDFSMSLATRNEQAAHTINATQKVLRIYTTQGPDAKQLELAKQFLTGSLPLQFASNTAIANATLKIASYGLPLDFYDKYLVSVKMLTAEKIFQAWQQHLQPQNLITVQVGGHVKQ